MAAFILFSVLSYSHFYSLCYCVRLTLMFSLLLLLSLLLSVTRTSSFCCTSSHKGFCFHSATIHIITQGVLLSLSNHSHHHTRVFAFTQQPFTTSHNFFCFHSATIHIITQGVLLSLSNHSHGTSTWTWLWSLFLGFFLVQLHAQYFN